MLPQWHEPSHSALKSSSSEGLWYGWAVLQAMSSSFTISSLCTVLLTSGSFGEDMNASGFELKRDCGNLGGDGARAEILWAFLLYAWADDVNSRLPFRHWRNDNRVAENMASLNENQKGSQSAVFLGWTLIRGIWVPRCLCRREIDVLALLGFFLTSQQTDNL